MNAHPERWRTPRMPWLAPYVLSPEGVAALKAIVALAEAGRLRRVL